MKRRFTIFSTSVAALYATLTCASAQPVNERFLVRNLVSDLSGLATNTDAKLVNPWGIAFSPTSPFWISDNGKGLSTLHNSTGAVQTLVVTIPVPAGGQPPASPTGIIFNNTSGFALGATPARFIFVTEEGTVVA